MLLKTACRSAKTELSALTSTFDSLLCYPVNHFSLLIIYGEKALVDLQLANNRLALILKFRFL